MNNNFTWLLISDFDNTQAPTAGQRLQPSVALPSTFVLKDMAERGEIPLVHCTGRSPAHLIRDIENAQHDELPGPHAARTEMILASVGTEAFQWDEEQGLYTPMEGLIDHVAADFFERSFDDLKAVIEQTPGLKLQSADHLGPYKISGWKDPEVNMSNEELYGALLDTLEGHGFNEDDLAITASMQSKFAVDLTPAGATKGNAVRFAAKQYGVPLKDVYYAGDSINDLDAMLVEDVNVILPGNAQDILVDAVCDKVDQNRIRRTSGLYAQGIFAALVLEGRLPEMPAIPQEYAHLSGRKLQHPVSLPELKPAP